MPWSTHSLRASLDARPITRTTSCATSLGSSLAAVSTGTSPLPISLFPSDPSVQVQVQGSRCSRAMIRTTIFLNDPGFLDGREGTRNTVCSGSVLFFFGAFRTRWTRAAKSVCCARTSALRFFLFLSTFERRLGRSRLQEKGTRSETGVADTLARRILVVFRNSRESGETLQTSEDEAVRSQGRRTRTVANGREEEREESGSWTCSPCVAPVEVIERQTRFFRR